MSMAIERARALVGTRFRLHGRDPETGLDCVGLMACAAEVTVPIPTGYAIRGGDADSFATMIDGFATRRTEAPQAGDVVLIAVSSIQFHMGLWTGDSLIHAHAGFRRVVETPGPVAGTIVSAWTLSKDNM